MKDLFEQIREQIYDIRVFLGPVDLKLERLDYQINTNRMAFEAKISELESRISVNSVRTEEQASQIAENTDLISVLSEQVRQIRQFLKMRERPQTPAPVREDKKNPVVLPPQAPPKFKTDGSC